MASSDMETQPAPVETPETLELPGEYPEEKSGVRIKHDPTKANHKFSKGETVHMSTKNSRGGMSKGVFTVYKSQINKKGAFVEYQLLDRQNALYKDGKWVRENDLDFD
ncbi:hypothetical protein BS50DRAFT_638131 [Corynespora cassiicola Philippines]|uniref:Uncharacterized protein n=1 Tax=Corynespora cassiicola Philippines TaxID=1448308 RepID=A0A2T2NB69_CORCC|nr:hypothetical protein BS50DRAFT_638131 [Corynespora cassiicola Philippines]